MRMFRFAIGVMRLDRIRNEYIRGTAKVIMMGMKLREIRLRLYGNVLRRDEVYVGRQVMNMELPGKRRKGRPKRRYMNVVKENMRALGVRAEDARDRGNWRKTICGGYP